MRFPSHVAVFSFFFPPPSPAPPTPTRRQLPHLLLTVPTPGEGRASLRALFRRAAVSPWELSREKFTITRSGGPGCFLRARLLAVPARPPAFCARADADLLLGRCHGARRGLQRPELSPGAGVAGHLCPDTCWARGGEGEREETSCRWSQREFLGGLEHEPLEPPPPSVTEPRQGVRGHSPLRSGPKCQGVGVRQEQPLASEGAAWTVYGRFTDAQRLHPSGRWRGVLGPSARARADSGLRGPGGSSHPSRPLPGASAFAGDVYRAPLCARLCEGLAVYLTGSLQQGRKAAGVTALRRGH